MIQKYLENVFFTKGFHRYHLELKIERDELHDDHKAYLFDLSRKRNIAEISWDEQSFRQVEIWFDRLDPEEDKSLIRGLDFYYRSKDNRSAHIMFKKYENFIMFFDIIAIGGITKAY